MFKTEVFVGNGGSWNTEGGWVSLISLLPVGWKYLWALGLNTLLGDLYGMNTAGKQKSLKLEKKNTFAMVFEWFIIKNQNVNLLVCRCFLVVRPDDAALTFAAL